MKKPIIQFDNYSFKYRTQASPTLHDINLTICEGEKVLIVGPSGSGKSTLGSILNGLIPNSYKGDVKGTLKIKGKDVTKQSIFHRSESVGTVLQDPDGQFVSLTVGEDIAFALENNGIKQKDMLDRVKAVSEMVDMETFLTSSVHELSGGQKQRVALAGIMVDEVDILLFDEPLANLDPATGKHAIHLVDRIHKETLKTIIMIEHRIEDVLASSVDKIVVMNQGRIVTVMSPSELLTTNILEENNIREPLYIKALKYAGISITPDMQPEHIDSIQLQSCVEKLTKWYQSSSKIVSKQMEKPFLEVKDIQFSYQSTSKMALNNVSFSINKGEMVSIVGKNGAGKSTLSKLICGFEKPSNGCIFLDGVDITNDTIKERAKRIGMVMQNPNHMISKHMIFDEVALGLRIEGMDEAEIKERVEKTLKTCGLYPFRNWPINALSFGQKKRVTIASILVMEPEILILDEPTAGQDFRHYSEMMEFITDLNKLGVTIILITHDMHLMLEYTPRAIVIAKGNKIADDTAVNIITDSNVIQEANLKETSLFELATKAGLENPREFVQRFIDYDCEVREHGRDVILHRT